MQSHIHLNKIRSVTGLCDCYVIKKEYVKYLTETFKLRISQFDCSQISPYAFLFMETDTETNL